MLLREQQLRRSTVLFTAHTSTPQSVNLCLLQPEWTTTTKRREQNIIYLYAEVRLKRNDYFLMTENCARRIVLLKLITDRQAASRGLSATAGLHLFKLFSYLYVVIVSHLTSVLAKLSQHSSDI